MVNATANSFPATASIGRGVNQNKIALLKLSESVPSVTATVQSSAEDLEVGTSVTLTGSAMLVSGGPATGTLVFYRGSTALASADLVNGMATATVTLPVGIHELRVIYRGGGQEVISGSLYQLINTTLVCN